MKINNSGLWCLLFLFAGFSPGAFAEEQKSVDCAVQSYDGSLFKSLYESAAETARVFCSKLVSSRLGQNKINDRLTGSLLSDFAAGSEAALDNLRMDESADYKEQFEQLKTGFKSFDFADIRMPEFKVRRSLGGPYQGYFEPLDEEVDRITINEVEHCRTVSSGQDCKDIFKDFAQAFNPYRSAYDNVYDNEETLDLLGQRWDSFLEASKSQTALEVFLTTWVQGSHFRKDHLVEPPAYQVIALHPQLVYNSMDTAPDGSNQELGLAIEWAGVNFWNLEVGDFGMPLGISLASVYVDRPRVRDVGHGFMVHIYNRYAIGWASHGSNNSIYITIDLLKMFEDKKSKYDSYMKNYF